jgi:hypothetical protein
VSLDGRKMTYRPRLVALLLQRTSLRLTSGFPQLAQAWEPQDQPLFINSSTGTVRLKKAKSVARRELLELKSTCGERGHLDNDALHQE